MPTATVDGTPVVLLPCPFCGGEPRVVPSPGSNAVMCGLCHASTWPAPSAAAAVPAWNRREGSARDAAKAQPPGTRPCWFKHYLHHGPDAPRGGKDDFDWLKAWFHTWTHRNSDGTHRAIVEDETGQIRYVYPDLVRFGEAEPE